MSGQPVYEVPSVTDLGTIAELTEGSAGATPDLTLSGSQ